jgi:CspA family cold shock protein
MNIKNTVAVLVSAFILTLLAYLIELSTKLPEPVAYFAIAVLAASFTLLLVSIRFRALSRRRSNSPARGKGSDKETGSVKWFSASKGFGFITRDNGEDIFVHFRSIAGNGHRILREGQRVEFAVTEGSKGLQAEDVIALK